jgi:hypothetical protein
MSRFTICFITGVNSWQVPATDPVVASRYPESKVNAEAQP